MRGEKLAVATALPQDWRQGHFLGRVETPSGPIPVIVHSGLVYDMSKIAPTLSLLVERRAFDAKDGELLPAVDELHFLSPLDLQCVKASGVTFAVSALERVIEERARGDASVAQDVRTRLEAAIGGSIRSVVPGSPEAEALKTALVEDGMWSQYLEVAIGPDAEIFTKAPILSTLGWGADIGVRSDSTWNNPEPEIVLLVDSSGETLGATLGNDVNLRDFEGRSALLLGKAKDNNASCSVGPLIRLFDDGFSIDDVRSAELDLRIEGTDGYVLTGRSAMDQISRDPLELVRQCFSEHQYPDGVALFLGTLFAPIEDRDEPGRGFTHKLGDEVTISTPKLGALVNRITTSKAASPWTYGVGALMQSLAARNLLTPASRL